MIKKYHVSKNLFDQSDFKPIQVTAAGDFRCGTILGILPQGNYTFNAIKSASAPQLYLTMITNGVYTYRYFSSVPFSFTADGTSIYIIRISEAGIVDSWSTVGYTDIIVNAGSTPLPYEPYGDVFKQIPYRKYTTATDTFTSFPTELIADSVSAYTIKGNMAQNGTSTPSNLTQPLECGVLETTGAHAGEYKIPILSGNTTTNIYIGNAPLRKSIDGSDVYDTIESNGTLTRRVDENGDALATPTVTQITTPIIPTLGTAEQFDVDTPLKPSELSLTYTGWHSKNDTRF